VKWLLECGADPTVAVNCGVTCLYMACQDGHVAVVEELLKKDKVKASINEAIGVYGTPLQIANQNGHKEVVALLKANGAK